MSSSAISRAVQDASAGEFASAIETLVTAISLIKQSKIASDDRCKILISSLQDTLHGIEEKSYGSKSSSRRSRSRERDRERKERSRSHRSRIATGKESTEREVENEIAIMRPSPVPHHLGLTEIETEKETGTGNVNTAADDINFAFYLVYVKMFHASPFYVNSTSSKDVVVIASVCIMLY